MAIGAAIVVAGFYFFANKGTTAQAPAPPTSGGDNNNLPDPNSTVVTNTNCQGTEFLINGKKVCETALYDMGFVYIKHPTITDGWYYYTDVDNSQRLSNADFLQWVRDGATVLSGSYDPQLTTYYTKMFNTGFKGTAPLQAV